MIEQATLNFLSNLENNNSREWFLEHKNEYEIAKENFIDFCSEILRKLKTIEPSFYNTNVKECIFRINRDVRFSKDKSPYKNYFSAGFGAGGRNSGKIDYYLQIEPNNAFLGAGMWQPSSQNLEKFRQEIDYSPEKLLSIIENPIFQKHFPIIHGQKLKTKPKNYDANHPNIELLKYKELFFLAKFQTTDIIDNNFESVLFNHAVILKPYINYLNQIFFENE